MCGISGILRRDLKTVDVGEIVKINETLFHRGPDYGQVQLFDHVALGHRRLSIIDLSNEANQPMFSKDNRYVIVFNGEVYNFKEIKQELLANNFSFITSSDTEVVLNAYIHYGVKCFEMFNGMFALAIFDKFTKQLVLARDQFGVKPLYYYWGEDVFIFGSEIKAILSHENLRKDGVNSQALAEYLWFGNPMGDNTIYKNIVELDGGCYMEVSETSKIIKRYFDINKIAQIKPTEEVAIKEIKRLFEESVQRHLVSDVPVGVLLSGGIDSSAITAFASKHYDRKLTTFSVAFDFAQGPNELDRAAEIAKMYNTDHHEVHISGNDVIDVIEELVAAHDEPFGDAADIPLYLLTRKLSNTIKVVLQGDGGDEFFGGYSRYKTLQNADLWSKFSWMSGVVKGFGIKNTKALRFQRFLDAISHRDKSVRNALLLTMESEHNHPFRILNNKILQDLNGTDPFKRYKEVYSNFSKEIDPIQALFYTDTQIILKDTFFEKVDKSTMASSIEVRVPFLDKCLTEYMLSLPASLKVKNGVQKYLLKKALEGTVPNNILYGKKTGFSVPYGYWLKTSLSGYFMSQISTSLVSRYLDLEEIKKLYKLHIENKGNYDFLLWKTLIFAVWINKNQIIND